MEKIKIIFFDIDGTLYDREDPRKIPASTRKAIQELKRTGCRTVICTGRAMSCIEPYIQSLGFDGYIAGCGTHILYQGKELWYQVLEEQTVQQLEALSLQEQGMSVFEGSSYLYINREECSGNNLSYYHFYQHFYEGKVRPLSENQGDICKMTIRLNPDPQKVPKGSRLEDRKRRICAACKQMGMTALDKGLSIEIYPAGSGKGEGIRRFLTLTGCEDAQTYAFGDGVNDIPMMQEVGCGIALGHAAPELLRFCTWETDDLYEDGIYKACRKLHLIS